MSWMLMLAAALLVANLVVAAVATRRKAVRVRPLTPDQREALLRRIATRRHGERA